MKHMTVKPQAKPQQQLHMLGYLVLEAALLAVVMWPSK
jgi:hypothetical protein